MVKSKRKRKSQNQNDFNKPKLKVGRKLQKSDAHIKTNIEFKSRAVYVPSQSLEPDKGAKVTKRNLTRADLVTQLSHPSSSIRKDALFGLKELLEEFTDDFRLNLAITLPQIAIMIMDQSQMVRTQYLAWLKSFLTLVDRSSITSFLDFLRVHINSALTHIDKDVRLDALKALIQILKVHPLLLLEHREKLYTILTKLMGKEHQEKIVAISEAPCATSAKHKSNSIDNIKSSAIDCLHQIVVYESTRVVQQKRLVSVSYSVRWDECNQSISNFNIQQLSTENTAFALIHQNHGMSDNSSKNYTMLIAPSLIDLWVELSPSTKEGTNYVDYEILHKIVTTLTILIQRSPPKSDSSAEQQWLQSVVKPIQRHVWEGFPLQNNNNLDISVMTKVQQISVELCQLFVEIFHQSQHLEKSRFDITHITRILQYISTLYDEQQPYKLNYENVVQLQDIINSLMSTLLNSTDTTLKFDAIKEDALDLFERIYKFYTTLHHLSNTKKALMLFFSSWMDRTYNEKLSLFPIHPTIRSWVLGLPKILWQLKAESLESSAIILKILLKIHQYGRNETHLLEEIQNRLLPIYASTIGERAFTPPFTTWPLSLKLLSLDVMGMSLKWNSPISLALLDCGLDNYYTNNEVLQRFIDLLSYREKDPDLNFDEETLANFIWTLLIGHRTKELKFIQESIKDCQETFGSVAFFDKQRNYQTSPAGINERDIEAILQTRRETFENVKTILYQLENRSELLISFEAAAADLLMEMKILPFDILYTFHLLFGLNIEEIHNDNLDKLRRASHVLRDQLCDSFTNSSQYFQRVSE